MTITTDLVLTPSARPGGLLSVTRPLSAGWTRGVDVLIGSVLSPELVGPCVDSSGEPQPPGEVVRFVPVQIRQGVYCSTLGSPDVEGYAETAVTSTIEFSLSSELVSGTATSNASLSDADSLGSFSDACDALAALEDATWTGLYGRQGVIHIPVGLADCLGDSVYRSGSTWRTVAGSLVAIHGTGSTMYATGEVWAAWQRAGTNSYVNRAVNTAEAWADALGLIVFDPAFNVSATVTG
jgi:hypothetical protein